MIIYSNSFCKGHSECSKPKTRIWSVLLILSDLKSCINCMTWCITVDGGWTPWTSWGKCSTTCGPGTSYRTRTCSNPHPTRGGNYCAGSWVDSQTCNTQDCPGIMLFVLFTKSFAAYMHIIQTKSTILNIGLKRLYTSIILSQKVACTNLKIKKKH